MDSSSSVHLNKSYFLTETWLLALFARKSLILKALNYILKIICRLVVRTLTGHKANVNCIDFHPYGDFAASGSHDTTVRVNIYFGLEL